MINESTYDLFVGDVVLVLAPANPFWQCRRGVVSAIYGDQIVVDFNGLRGNFLRRELRYLYYAAFDGSE